MLVPPPPPPPPHTHTPPHTTPRPLPGRYTAEGGYCGIDDRVTFYLAYGVPVVTMLVLGGVLALRCGPQQSSRGVQLLTLAAATLAAGAATPMQLAMTESNGTDNSGYELATTALSALFAITFVCAAAMRQRFTMREDPTSPHRASLRVWAVKTHFRPSASELKLASSSI
jgi:peptidoglycan/LPS O-acetylase OafA/YrhL